MLFLICVLMFGFLGLSGFIYNIASKQNKLIELDELNKKKLSGALKYTLGDVLDIAKESKGISNSFRSSIIEIKKCIDEITPYFKCLDESKNLPNKVDCVYKKLDKIKRHLDTIDSRNGFIRDQEKSFLKKNKVGHKRPM